MSADAIRPALDAEEWGWWLSDGGISYEGENQSPKGGEVVVDALAFERDDGGIHLPNADDPSDDVPPFERPRALLIDTEGNPGRVDAPILPALIALANERLPDGDPYKITRADIELVRESAERVAAFFFEGGAPGETERRALLTLAAKLNALLPPEPAP